MTLPISGAAPAAQQAPVCPTHSLHGTTDPACFGCQMDKAAQTAADIERWNLREEQWSAALHTARRERDEALAEVARLRARAPAPAPPSAPGSGAIEELHCLARSLNEEERADLRRRVLAAFGAATPEAPRPSPSPSAAPRYRKTPRADAEYTGPHDPRATLWSRGIAHLPGDGSPVTIDDMIATEARFYASQLPRVLEALISLGWVEKI